MVNKNRRNDLKKSLEKIMYMSRRRISHKINRGKVKQEKENTNWRNHKNRVCERKTSRSVNKRTEEKIFCKIQIEIQVNKNRRNLYNQKSLEFK